MRIGDRHDALLEKRGIEEEDEQRGKGRRKDIKRCSKMGVKKWQNEQKEGQKIRENKYRL